MSADQQINITATPNTDGVITILHGKAKEPELPRKPLKIVGNISAPVEYSHHTIDWDLVNPLMVITPITPTNLAGRITFITDTDNPYADTVVGMLNYTDPLKNLAINTENKCSLKDLIRRLRTVAHYIRGEGFEAVIRRLTSFTSAATVETRSDEIRRGKGGASHFVSIDTDVPATITFCAPWFGVTADLATDIPDLFIDVDVCFDLSGPNASMQFWLDAPWMTDQIFRHADAIMSAVVARRPEGLLCIVGSVE
jgi:hypothetical protein